MKNIIDELWIPGSGYEIDNKDLFKTLKDFMDKHGHRTDVKLVQSPISDHRSIVYNLVLKEPLND